MDKKVQALNIVDYVTSAGHAMWIDTEFPASIPTGYFQEKIDFLCRLIDEIGGTEKLKNAVRELTPKDYAEKEWTA